MTPSDLPDNRSGRWDLQKNADGSAAVLTPLQVRAVWRAIEVWQDVCRKELGEALPFTSANLAKSRLLGRMLVDGRPPLPEAPPRYLGARGYHLVDPDLCPTCGAERTAPPRELGRSDRRPSDLQRLRAEQESGHTFDKTVSILICAEPWHTPSTESPGIPDITAPVLPPEPSNGPHDLEVASTEPQHVPAPPASLVDIPGLAEWLGTSVRHVRRLVATKAIPYVKVGHLVRFDPEDITNWIEGNMVPPGKPVPQGDSNAARGSRAEQ